MAKLPNRKYYYKAESVGCYNRISIWGINLASLILLRVR